MSASFAVWSSPSVPQSAARSSRWKVPGIPGRPSAGERKPWRCANASAATSESSDCTFDLPPGPVAVPIAAMEHGAAAADVAVPAKKTLGLLFEQFLHQVLVSIAAAHPPGPD